MKWQIAAVGKPGLAYTKLGVDEYLRRLERMLSLEITYLKDLEASRLRKMSDGALRIALDERGEHWTTAQFAERVTRWEQEGSIKRVLITIGGADGLDDEHRASADVIFALSHFTLQHELALVVLLEQLYRVYSLKRGEPYHRP